MDLVDPLTHSLIGPHINRRTMENVRKAGPEIVSIEDSGLIIMKKMRAR